MYFHRHRHGVSTLQVDVSIWLVAVDDLQDVLIGQSYTCDLTAKAVHLLQPLLFGEVRVCLQPPSNNVVLRPYEGPMVHVYGQDVMSWVKLMSNV